MRIVAYAEAVEAGITDAFGEELVAHLTGISSPDKARLSRCAWKLLEAVVRQAGICPIPRVWFMENGKPCFEGNRCYFSISHSRGLCAVSLSDVPTGVDVERCRDEYAPALIDRVLSPREKRTFDGDFTRLWCRKECIAKLTGLGLDECPVEIDTLDAGWEFADQQITGPDGMKYQLSAAFMKKSPYNEGLTCCAEQGKIVISQKVL